METSQQKPTQSFTLNEYFSLESKNKEQTYKLIIQESMDPMAFGVNIKNSLAPFRGVTSIHTKSADGIKKRLSHKLNWKV
jgi:hypothetical protein